MKFSFSVLNYIHLRSIPSFSFDGLRGVKRMWVSFTIWSSALAIVHVCKTFLFPMYFWEVNVVALNLNVKSTILFLFVYYLLCDFREIAQSVTLETIETQAFNNLLNLSEM